MNKKKVIVLSIIGFIVFFVLAAMTACTAFFVNELDKEAERVEQQVEQQIEEPTIQDEYLTEEDLPPIEQQSSALEVIQPYVDEAFENTGLTYYLKEEIVNGETVVMLIIDFSYEEIQSAVESGDWNEISYLGVNASEALYNILVTEGVNAHFGIVIGDVATDSYYFSALDGQLVVDVPNGVQ